MGVGSGLNCVGVLGKTSEYQSAGVKGVATGSESVGVLGQTSEHQSAGVKGVATGSESVGVLGQTSEHQSAGVKGVATGSESVGVLGQSETGIAGRFLGNVEVTGDINLLNADCAEDFDIVEENVEAGTVMVLNEMV